MVDNVLSYISIPYKLKKNAWTTILIIWLGVKYHRQGIYTINNEKQGKFISNTPAMFGSDTGKYDSTEYLNGSI